MHTPKIGILGYASAYMYDTQWDYVSVRIWCVYQPLVQIRTRYTARYAKAVLYAYVGIGRQASLGSLVGPAPGLAMSANGYQLLFTVIALGPTDFP